MVERVIEGVSLNMKLPKFGSEQVPKHEAKCTKISGCLA
jgi:hypothetical protein